MVILPPRAFSFPPRDEPSEVFGVAHVDGKYFLTTEDFLDEGADQILATGSKVIKLYLDPRRYPWNSSWPKDIQSLAQMALASYSCYTFLDTPERLGQAVEYLAAHLPPTAVFGRDAHSVYLGEFGYPETGEGGLDALNRRIDNAIKVVRDQGLPWAVFWEIYCNEPVKKALQLPLNGKENNANLRGFWMVKPDGTPGLAWHRYRRLFANADPDRATTQAIKSKLKQVFGDSFNRPDGKELGTGWTQASHYGVVNERLAHHRVRFEIPDGHDIPWGSATLDLANRAILGHGLQVGDYFEVTLQRLSEQGGLGVELFDSDQLRVGGDLRSGPSMLQAWNGTTWVSVAFDDHGQPVSFDWNGSHTLGVRFDSADGHWTTFSYYLDGFYAGSWLIASPNRKLDKIGFFVQSRTAGSAFEFGDLKVFAVRRSSARASF